MIAKSDFIITNHARERFVERFSEENRKIYTHLKKCKQGCDLCIDLTFKLAEEIKRNRIYLDRIICDKLRTADETRIHHNNHKYMSRMLEKYGDNPAHLLVNNDILFVVIDAEAGKICVTCMDVKDSILGDFVRRPKYKKKQSV